MKKVLRFIGVFAICIIGACILIYIIGTVVDLSVQRALIKEGESALQQLRSLERHGENNAWPYYAQVIQDIKKGDLKSWNRVSDYLHQNSELTPKMERDLKSFPDVPELIRKGNAQPFCAQPITYEDGMTAELPEYIHLIHASKLIGAQTVHALEQGDIQTALSKNLLGLRFARQMMQGSPILLNQMISLVILSVHLHTLEIGLTDDTYDLDHLEDIQHTLLPYENDMPAIYESLRLEFVGSKVLMMDVPLHAPIFQMIDIIESNIIHMFATRLICWRYVFSPRLAMYKGGQRMDEIFEAATHSAQGKQGTEKDLAAYQSIMHSDLERYATTNKLYGLFIPQTSSMFKRKTTQQARVRLVVCGITLRIHEKKFGNFPELLDAFDEQITRDPFTNETWEYTVQDDRIIIQSPGFDQDYDTDDDLELVLYKD